jgi:hypothetical protein
MRGKIRGEIRFLFQHAEEEPPGGAGQMIEAGVMEGVDAVIGIHLSLYLPVGKIGLGYVDRLPSAWDLVARQQKGSWVKIQLKDDQGVVAGRFGDHSVASLDPRRADVYLEQAWRLDELGNFADPVVDTRGVWIAHDVMAYVLLFDRWEGPDVPHNPEADEFVEDDPS